MLTVGTRRNAPRGNNKGDEVMFTFRKLKSMVLFGGAILMLSLTMVVQAGDPGAPVAHWPFEEGGLQTVCNNVNPGTYDGYRGRTKSIESSYDAPWVSGLNGSTYALQFSNDVIVTIMDIGADTNGDRVADSGPLAGSFSMFMRVDLPNADYQMLATADKGPSDKTRGFYFDTLASGVHGSTWRLGLRFSFNSPTNNTLYSVGGQSGDIAVTNVESIGFTFLADPNPSDANNDGSFQYYVNGSPFYSAKAHNAPYLGVSGNGFWIGKNFEGEQAKGAVIDDVAIWDKVLTADEMMYIETNALPQPAAGPGRNPGYPYAHWECNEGSGQTVQNRMDPGTNDGYLGTSAGNTTRDPTWISGLNGSSAALQYDNTDVVVIKDIADDLNTDRVADSGPLAGSFTMFYRVNLPNLSRAPIVNADKETPVTDRGFYMDMYQCYEDAGGNYHFGIRVSVSSPTNDIPSFAKSGSASTPTNTAIETIVLSFLADPNPDDASSDGVLDFYVDGTIFHTLSHNCPYFGVSGNNKLWLARDTYNTTPGGLILDDVAIWDKAMNENEIYYLVHTGVPRIIPPSGIVIIIK